MRKLILAALAFFLSASLAAAATDYKKDFLNRYKFFITPSEYKEFKKLTTDEEKDKFIVDFWAKRNPDCSPEKSLECPTLQNKFKDLVDKRLRVIEEDKILVSDPDTFGLRFSANGGITGDLAHVYLLHGLPNDPNSLPGWKGKLEGTYFVDMVLWIYVDERGNEKYRFLFYQKFGLGQYSLFKIHDWTWPPWRALDEISKFGRGDPERLNDVLNELLYTKATQDSYRFFNALQEFSQTGKNLDEALDPPTPADVIAKKHDMRIAGTLTKAENLKIPSSSASMIPASLRYYPGSGFRVLGVNSDLDWFEEKDKLASYLMIQATFQDESDPQKEIPSFETYFRVALPKEAVENNPAKGIVFEPPGLNKAVQSLPPGTYLVNIYIRNTLDKPKYNHYQETIKK